MKPTDLSLLTDLYQLTMAQAYWLAGMAETHATFHLYYRRPPFGGGGAIAAGIEPAICYVESLRFDPEQVAFLAQMPAPGGGLLFRADFLAWLGEQAPALDVDAMPEGSLVLAHEPILRVRGPLALAQIVETTLLNILNFQTLVATKAARICTAAAGREVLEFGLRRAQGPDGGLAASRAAYVGGVTATSNVLAGQAFGIPVRGTHAHAWVMAHEHEHEAFANWAQAMPGNALFLVDTWDTATGVQNAIVAGRALEAAGGRFLGVRLDSGDLGALAFDARRALDAAGFPKARIVASSDLDEHAIVKLVRAGAPIDTFGVGTRLVTGHDQPALGGVYKLGAVGTGDARRTCVKRSEDVGKIAVGGCLQVRRGPDGDTIWDEADGPPDTEGEDLLQPALVRGARPGTRPTPSEALRAARERATVALAAGWFHPTSPTPLAPARWSAPLAARRAAITKQESV